MARTWKVGNTTDRQTEKITQYFVTDANETSEIDDRPKAAVFPVSVLFDRETQGHRAQQFAEYLNKLDEAAKVALEQTHLIDIMSRP